MKSFQTLYTSIQNQIFDTTSATLAIIKQWINDSIHKRTNDPRNLVFLEKSATIITQQGQQFYPLPVDFGKLIRISVQIGNTLYSPAEAPNKLFWDRLNYIGKGTFQSQVQYFFYIQGSPGNYQIGLYPTPSTQGTNDSSSTAGVGVINFFYQSASADLTADDYTIGTVYQTTTTGAGTVLSAGVTTTSAGVTTVTGTTTGAGAVAWTSAMVNRWLQIPVSAGGDGFWYQIATVPTANTLTLNLPYSGTTLYQAAASYTIAQMSPIPDGYEDIIEEDVLARHFRRIQDFDTALVHQQIADQRFEQLIADKSAKVASPYSSPQVDLTIPNINSFPTNLSGF